MCRLASASRFCERRNLPGRPWKRSFFGYPHLQRYAARTPPTPSRPARPLPIQFTPRMSRSPLLISPSDAPARRRSGRIAPIGGTTLLVLVTLVLATGHRDTMPVRQSFGDVRWAEPASPRQSHEAESHPNAPTKPSATKFLGIGPSRPQSAIALQPQRPSAGAFAAHCANCARRLACITLLNLPPPRR